MNIILLLHLFMLTFTFGHVELLTVDYHSIDTPITELNNYTLREVFENNYQNVFNYTIYSDQTKEIYLDGIKLTKTNINGTIGVYKVIGLIQNQNYYIHIKHTSSDNTAIRVYLGSGTVINSVLFNDGVYSQKVIIGGNEAITYISQSSKPIGHILQLSEVYYVNTDIYGISSLTVEQMESYFEMYQENQTADDVTYVQNEMTITDLTYILGFSFVWVVIIWSIRKVVL